MSDMNDFNASIIAEFRAHAGKVGGNFEGAPMLLLHTTGAKSKAERINPLMYLSHDDRLFVFASKAGADTNPDWFANIAVNPGVSVELGAEVFDATASAVPEPQRSEIYGVMAAAFQNFAEYAEKTTRIIPVVELVRA